jgi:hypothetical protein
VKGEGFVNTFVLEEVAARQPGLNVVSPGKRYLTGTQNEKEDP